MTFPQHLRERCAHLDTVRRVRARSDGCEECLAQGGAWSHLRVCLACGHVGCCDASAGTHARRHAEATGHPIVAPLDASEPWAWCYPDAALLPGAWADWWRA